MISPVARPLPARDKTNTEETRADIHVSSGIRAAIAVFEQAKIFHTLDRAAIVIDT
jgi:hypothetical protein